MSLRYLLDTNIISDLVRRPRGPVASRIAEVGEDSICTSIIVAAEPRPHLARQGTPIGPNDLLIAAHALTAKLLLATTDTHDFQRLPALRVENWLSELVSRWSVSGPQWRCWLFAQQPARASATDAEGDSKASWDDCSVRPPGFAPHTRRG